MDLSVTVSAFVCDGCAQKQIGEPRAALCLACEKTRETQSVTSGGDAAAAKVLMEGIETKMRLWVDRQVMNRSLRVEVAQYLDRMIDHALQA